MASRIIMLVDLDYFYAQAEEIRNPSIKTNPVVVCVYSGRTPDSGAVSTANYAARKYGVRSGMPIFMAKRKLENVNAVFLPVDHKYYEEVSERVMAILRSRSDRFEQVGIDEAFLDVTARVKADFDETKRLAQQIKQEILAKEGLTCSIGVGPNKLVAKVAADAQKPDGLTVINKDGVQGFLAPLEINRLIGVGKKTELRMKSFGITTIDDLRRFDARVLEETFGRTLANYFYNASRGIDDEPVEEAGPAGSISRIATLKEDTRDLQTILGKAYSLSDEVHADIMQRGMSFRSVSVMGVFDDLTMRSRSKTLEESTNELETFNSTVKELFQRLLSESDRPLRRIGVRVASLGSGDIKQERLTRFLDCGDSPNP